MKDLLRARKECVRGILFRLFLSLAVLFTYYFSYSDGATPALRLISSVGTVLAILLTVFLIAVDGVNLIAIHRELKTYK